MTLLPSRRIDKLCKSLGVAAPFRVASTLWPQPRTTLFLHDPVVGTHGWSVIGRDTAEGVIRPMQHDIVPKKAATAIGRFLRWLAMSDKSSANGPETTLGCSVKNKPNASQKTAVGAIKKLGGRVAIDTRSPDRPVTATYLDHDQVSRRYLRRRIKPRSTVR